MPELTSLFPDVADALDIESVAIVEKDYFVVDLLRLLKEIKPGVTEMSHLVMF